MDGISPANTRPTPLQNGLPLYVYRIGSLNSSVQKELNAVSPERRYQRM